MKRVLGLALSILFMVMFVLSPMTAMAATKGQDQLAEANKVLERASTEVEMGDLEKAKASFEEFRKTWLQIENNIKPDSSAAYTDIEAAMGQFDYAAIKSKRDDLAKALTELQAVNNKYISSGYAAGSGFEQQDITLSDFIVILQQTKGATDHSDANAALSEIKKARQSWLSVEGAVVAQSGTVYSDSERDLVVIQAMLEQGDLTGAGKTVASMITYLTPLASKTEYTMMDAAMIPIREGLEALLVVGALLAFVKRSPGAEGKQGNKWIWTGIAAGLLFSLILAVVVKFVFSSGAFGQNNFVINGWTGIIAAVMLLYMSYWLHRQSSIKDWQQYIQNKSRKAMEKGQMISLGVLSFLAIFREGTETVLFLIGMVNQISMQNLILGILIGFGVLAVVAYLMLTVGVKLPIRPFFIVSSLIVFYLCLKFTGMGIHSLQLASTIPSTEAPLPSIHFIALYPSWQSAIPQLMIVVFAIIVIVYQRIQTKKNIIKPISG
ncbi:FTR1 family iron permease [Paenibacillus sp. N1-5-1-14]|uniref:FTR1 family iron permease n=1 Tax=Paenibacillus radicibacter TaxID=2972488 RepID=UPI002158A72B|nr:FTR1 family protein [Paenibacillus radicibacter]MCR8645391.1 FTR1 family iron permease [Paenibacillus radicibacter]